MTDIKSRLVDGMRGQAVKVLTPYGDRWIRLSDENLTLIVERLLSTLDLREITTSGYLDDRGFLTTWLPHTGAEYKKYVQYISGFHEADGED